MMRELPKVYVRDLCYIVVKKYVEHVEKGAPQCPKIIALKP